MGRACDIGVRLGICSKDFAEKTKNLLASYGYDMAPVPQALKEITNASERLLTAMKKDKKNMTASCIRLILQAAPLRTIIKEADDKDILSVLCEEKNKD
jgi:3-dehydroquinate synthetase